MPKLEDERLEKFAHLYVDRFNATQAAWDAGLAVNSTERSVAACEGNLALQRPDVQRRVRELNDAQLRRITATKDRTLREIARVGFSDIRHLFNEDGRLKPIHELKSDPAAAVKAVKVERRRVRNGKEMNLVTGKLEPVYEDYETVEIKMYDKVPALTLLAKHFKIVDDEGDGIAAIASALADRLKAGRSRSLTRHPTLEIEDAEPTRLHPRQLRGDGAPSTFQESGDGDRSDA